METLQTIWNILTTENEQLTNIIVSPLVFIESFLYFMIFTKVLKIIYSKKQQLLYICLISVLGLLTMFLIPSPFYTFVNILICPLLLIIIFKLNILKSLLAEVTIYIVSLMASAPVIIFFNLFLKLESFQIASVPFYKIIFSFVFYIFLFLLYKIVPKDGFSFNIVKKIKYINSTMFTINFILGTLAIAIEFYIEFLYINYIPTYLVVLSICILLLYFIISIYSLMRTNKLEYTTEKLEEEQLYNQTLGLLYDNIRGFKHDFNNIVQGIGGYISTNNIDGLKEYYSQILDDCQRVNNLSLLSPEVINNPAIYSLLASKYHVATEAGIKVNIEVFMDLSSINMKIYELTRVLGILLDNAIEASKQCEEKEINITMRKDSRLNKQLFIVENTYLNKDVNIDEIFEKGKTSKQSEDAKNHGLGLWEVRNLVKKRKNLNLYTTKDENNKSIIKTAYIHSI